MRPKTSHATTNPSAAPSRLQRAAPCLSPCSRWRRSPCACRKLVAVDVVYPAHADDFMVVGRPLLAALPQRDDVDAGPLLLGRAAMTALLRGLVQLGVRRVVVDR